MDFNIEHFIGTTTKGQAFSGRTAKEDGTGIWITHFDVTPLIVLTYYFHKKWR